MDFLKMMKQAKEMQARMEGLKQEFAMIEATGTAGDNRVSATVSAQGDLKEIKIDPSLLKPDEADVLEDLILAAHKQASEKARAEAQARTEAAMGGMGLPAGMKLPF